MRVQRCHSRPARPAHRALLETCALHRASLHCAASPCGSPSLLSLPAASGQREGSQSACAVLLVACHCLPISRVLAVDRSTFPWLCAASLASRRPALGHTSATLQPHTAPAQQPAVPCTFVPLLPPTSGSLSHSWPASVRPLRRWSSRSVVTFGPLPCGCLAPDRVARGRCAYVRLGGGNRSRPLPHCGSG